MLVKQDNTARRDDLVDTLHGVPVPDRYRWLEDGEAGETSAWTAAQNARTEAALAAAPGRAALEVRLRELLRVGTVGAPTVRGARLFYIKREGDRNQPILYARDGADGGERVVVDPNALDAAGLASLDWWEPSPEGRLVAYGVSRDGDEWSTLRVVAVDTGEVLPDAIDRCRSAASPGCRTAAASTTPATRRRGASHRDKRTTTARRGTKSPKLCHPSR